MRRNDFIIVAKPNFSVFSALPSAGYHIPSAVARLVSGWTKSRSSHHHKELCRDMTDIALSISFPATASAAGSAVSDGRNNVAPRHCSYNARASVANFRYRPSYLTLRQVPRFFFAKWTFLQRPYYSLNL
ncbi:hypothetical protein HTZ85_10565 [Escherichia coli]|nr:hypothetical protein [Escherichia coli]